jgi:hypothetical protein
MRLEADNDNRRRRTRADEQYDVIRILLGVSVLFVAANVARRLSGVTLLECEAVVRMAV